MVIGDGGGALYSSSPLGLSFSCIHNGFYAHESYGVLMVTILVVSLVVRGHVR